MASWSAIYGDTSEQRAAAVRRIVNALLGRGLRVDGYVQDEATASDGRRIGWNVRRIGTGETTPLARESQTPDLCTFETDPAAFLAARSWLEAPELDVAVFGVVGQLEAAGRGHWEAVDRVVRAPRGPHALLCIRAQSLTAVGLALPDPTCYLQLPASEAEELRFVADVAGTVP